MKVNSNICNYCSHPIEKRVKSCPHCGTLNPSMRTKEALYWTVGLMIVFFVVTYFMD